jgi:DNA-binding protein H-NS
VAKVRALIAEYGISAADLGLTGKASKALKGTRKKSAAAKPAGIPMYVDPASGKTWTGKGKQPNWIVEGLKKGKSKSDFLIAKTASPSSAKAKVSKSVKSVKAAKVPKAAKKVTPAPKAAKKVARKAVAKKALAKAVAAKAVVAAA